MPNSSRTLIVVGVRFQGFSSEHPDVLTISQLLEDLQSGLYGEAGEEISLRPGQGVTAADWDRLHAVVRRVGVAHRMLLEPHATEPLGTDEVHKRQESNALIAALRSTGPGVYRAALRIHNDNELLLDHQTGQHVQGMVVVEAARQMFLAVTERYYVDPERRGGYYFVIDSMRTSFENFLFPLAAEIEYQVTRADVGDPTRLSFTAEIGVHQAGRRCALTEVAFTAFESELIEGKEHRRAAHAVTHESRLGAEVGAGV
ncbi:AfsA-related hotdog domain-containing protein [Glycomyces terrestris]|nr:AfsA-related hotdog domain-containing protein [Glycomyces terrestris]